ncbi:hypothetical protein UZ36_02905 [Candidatus Nitromaritima sp. SCGC AAA799-C22]|nr:hypothetical protein UZ36_02905 [Candidatus Nitromaritima sp. SCGC AAA799-C22]
MAQKSSQEALKYLYDLIPTGIKLGLKNISCVLKELGDPQLKIPAIHIAGTNGKGSTAAFTESILRAAGYRVGLYTSPHLIHFSERIQIDRRPLPERELADLVFRVRKVVESKNIPITFFEFGTVMAFLYFAEQATDINVIEVGLGGRLDATNLCVGDISILTSISMDHASFLGAHIEQIAFEKASIIKAGGTVFAQNGEDQVLEVIQNMARERSAKIHILGQDFRVERTGQETSSQSITFIEDECRLERLQIPLLGEYQADNAALAVAACREQVGRLNGRLSDQTIRTGLESTCWNGRLEVVSTRPTLVLDCAHNPDAVKKLTKSARELFSYARAIVVLGMMKDKPTEEILEILSGFGDFFILVRPRQERSENPERLGDILCQFGKSSEVVEHIPLALQKIKNTAQPDDLVCITGSVFTVGEARQFLQNETNFKSDFSSSTGVHSGG